MLIVLVFFFLLLPNSLGVRARNGPLPDIYRADEAIFTAAIQNVISWRPHRARNFARRWCCRSFRQAARVCDAPKMHSVRSEPPKVTKADAVEDGFGRSVQFSLRLRILEIAE